MKATEIKHFRETLKLEIDELAEFLNVDSRSVSNWEKGACKPNATACSVMVGLSEAMRRKPVIIEFLSAKIKDTLGFGGISYFLVLRCL